MKTFNIAIATVAYLAAEANAFWGTAHLLSKYTERHPLLAQ